jgi:hypothetical protein
MKKLYTLAFAAALSATAASAQQIPNSNFETWELMQGLEVPAPFLSYDLLFLADSINVHTVDKSTDSHGGNFAAQISTGFYSDTIYIPIDSTGTVFDTIPFTAPVPGGLFATIPFTGHPTKLRGWVKANILNGDTAVIGVSLSHFDNAADSAVEVGGAGITLTDVSGWSQFEVDLEYPSAAPADTLSFGAFLLPGEFAFDTSRIIIDDIELVYGAVDVSEVNVYNASLYPNPSNGKLVVSAGNDLVGSELRVTDVAGRMVYSTLVGDRQTHLNIETPGMYFVTAHAANGSVVLRKKVTVQ